MVYTDFPIATDTSSKVKILNRDLSLEDKTSIQDSYAIRCYDDLNNTLWYIHNLTGYVYSTNNDILDMAYEQNGSSLYVLFNNDHYLYRYDNL